MPFYRVIQRYKELGVKISDSTKNDWYAAACEKLKPLYDILSKEVPSRDFIQVDESALPVIDNEKHRAVKGYMWCTRAVMDNLVVFQYDMGSRSHETARKLLRGYRGTIQTDGYGAYDQFEGDPHTRSSAAGPMRDASGPTPSTRTAGRRARRLPISTNYIMWRTRPGRPASRARP